MFQEDNSQSSDQPASQESEDQVDESANAGNEQGDADQPENQESQAVEINGEQITLEELKKGYMREADYRRKTQDLANERRKSEAQSQGSQYTPEEERAMKALDKLGVAKKSDVENLVRSMIAQQQIMSEKERIKASTGLEDDLLEAAQFMAVRNGITLQQAAEKIVGKADIKRKGLSPTGGNTAVKEIKGKPTVEEIRKMDPDSKEFAKVQEMMERGEL